MNKILIALTVVSFSLNTHALSLMGRMGIGTSNQFVNNMQSISLKVQRSRAMAIGAMIGLDANSDSTNYSFGGKLYRIIYDEPQLNFYSTAMFGLFSYQNATNSTATGYQADVGLGTEFSFQGLESIGFSFEFGIGYSRYNEKNYFKVMGHNMVTSAVHFYL